MGLTHFHVMAAVEGSLLPLGHFGGFVAISKPAKKVGVSPEILSYNFSSH